MYYRKKPVVIEAWEIGNPDRPAWACTDDVYESGDTWLVNTLEGTMQGRVGDYLIKGIKSELYICKKDIFEETYEEA